MDATGNWLVLAGYGDRRRRWRCNRAIILDLPVGHAHSLSLYDDFAGVCVLELASGVHLDVETSL